MKKWAVVGMAALALSGCAGTQTQVAPAPQPATTTATTPTPSPERTYSASDWTLQVEILRKQCFGSAGCNIRYQVEPVWAGSGAVPTGNTRLTYKVDGAESETIGTIEINGPKANVREESASTAEESDVLTATVTKLVYNGKASTTTSSSSGGTLSNVRSLDEALLVLETQGVTCKWERLMNDEATCRTPKVFVFVDPAPHLGGDLLGSKFKLYEAIFVGKGGLVYKGDNWVIGAETSQAPAIVKAMGY
ncbi:MAG TPA: hypothetical protein GXZ30_04585 [Propionibacterium sp.]|nr:hypothetical protein [Propionibacterium sp.]